jgi:hypothetical protein
VFSQHLSPLMPLLRPHLHPHPTGSSTTSVSRLSPVAVSLSLHPDNRRIMVYESPCTPALHTPPYTPPIAVGTATTQQRAREEWQYRLTEALLALH